MALCPECFSPCKRIPLCRPTLPTAKLNSLLPFNAQCCTVALTTRGRWMRNGFLAHVKSPPFLSGSLLHTYTELVGLVLISLNPPSQTTPHPQLHQPPQPPPPVDTNRGDIIYFARFYCVRVRERRGVSLKSVPQLCSPLTRPLAWERDTRH